MRRVISAAAVAALCSTAPAMAQSSGPNSPTLTHTNPSSCLGAERASRNSNGGDRAQGGFGQAQSEFVQYQKEGGTMNYGQWLKTWKETCTNAPGTTGKNTDTTTETTPPK